MTYVCNLLEIPLNRRRYMLYSVSILVEAKERRNALFFECNINSSDGKLEIKKGVELSQVAGWEGVEISNRLLEILSSDNWWSI